MAEPATHSTNSEPGAVLGSTTPRLWTPPLRELTPDTSFGFDFNDFCRDVLGEPNDPWQEWLSIHVGELLEDGRPRFRTCLILIARQQGKTTWAKKLVLFWLFILKVGEILGTSTDRSYAKKAWLAIGEMIRGNEWLRDELAGIRLTIGEELISVAGGSSYGFAANNGSAGRSMTLSRWLLDELREHNTFDAWNAADNAMNAVAGAQTVAISNQGDMTAVVLDSLRLPALTFIETGVGDRRLGLFEWSAPDGSDPEDLHALAMALPDLGNRTDPDVILAKARKAKAAGGEELTGFKTEVMCMRVTLLDPAIEPDAWKDAGTATPIKLSDHRDRVALCFDVSLDGSHATLMAAAVLDGKVHVEVVEQWDGHGCTQQVRRELPALVRKSRPRTIGWFPNGPAAAIAADLATKRGAGDWWPPPRVKLEELTAETDSVCMGLADLVKVGEVVHPKDALLDQHIASAQKLRRGDRWVFTRRATGPIDGAYAVAGAVHLARLLPPPLSPVTVA